MQRTHSRKKINHGQDKTVQMLGFILSFTKERGYPPSVREIGNNIGLMSSSTVHKLIKKCAESGYLETDENISRSIRVSKLGKKIVSSAK